MNLPEGLTPPEIPTTYRYITSGRELGDADVLNHFPKIPTASSREQKKIFKAMVCQTITLSNLKKLHNKLYTCIKHEHERSITSYVFPVHLLFHPNSRCRFQEQFCTLLEDFHKIGLFVYLSKLTRNNGNT